MAFSGSSPGAVVTSRAVKSGSLPGRRSSASMLQYSWAWKASISASRSQTSRTATDCTRPAEMLGLTLRQSTGLTL